MELSEQHTFVIPCALALGSKDISLYAIMILGITVLDWSKIDNEKIFQRLINHLFALECNSPGFIPSSPYIGADGGWDGYFPGFYPHENSTGIWSIQSKWTTKSFDDACSYLNSVIKDELTKARSNNVDHLRIATNAKLRIEHVTKLSALNNGEVQTLRVWHREELTRRVELQPYLKYLFFGSSQFPKFVPWDVYFGETEKHLLHIRTDLISRFAEYLQKIEEYLRSGSKNILIIHSPGGYGKSHLLRDIAENAHTVDKERQIWLIRSGPRKMEDAIEDEIIKDRKYLFIFDDADRFSDQITPLLALSRINVDFVKIILATRTSGLSTLRRKIRELKCEEICDEIQITDWSKDELIQLLRIVTEQEKVENEDIFATLYPNPFLIVWIGNNLTKKTSLEFKTVKKKIIDDIYYEAEQVLQTLIDSSQIDNFITHIASIVPFSPDDTTIRSILSNQFKVKSDIIVEIFQRLITIGVLRIVGTHLRFHPDIKGDLYLGSRLNKLTSGGILPQLLQTWLPVCDKKLITNLAEATKFDETRSLKSIFSEIVYFWIKDADHTPNYVRKHRLELLEKIAAIVPEECVHLLFTYMDSTAPPAKDPLLIGFKTIDAIPTTDDYGPVIQAIVNIPTIRKDVLTFIDRLAMHENVEGIYDNYKPNSLIKKWVSPLFNSQELILLTLSIFQEWLAKPSSSQVQLIAAALSEILAGSYHYDKPMINAFAWQEVFLQETTPLLEIRKEAIKVLKTMISHEDLHVKLVGIQTAYLIGKTIRKTESDLPLARIIAVERGDVVELIGQLITDSAEFRLLNEIDNLFLKWWAQQTPGTEKVEEYLLALPRTIEYIVYKCYVAPNYIIRNFELVKNQAPSTDKWKWFIENFSQKAAHFQPETYTDLAEILYQKYSSDDQILHFLIELHEQISQHDQITKLPIITSWVNTAPSSFLSIQQNPAYWNSIPEMFKEEITLTLGQNNTRLVQELADKVLSDTSSKSEINTFLQLLGLCSIPESSIKKWLFTLLEKDDSELRSLIVYRLYFIYRQIQNLPLIIEIINTAISHYSTLDEGMINALWGTIHNLKNEMDMTDPSIVTLQRELLEKMKNIPELNWYSQELLDFAFTGIDSAIRFIDYRLRKFREIRAENSLQTYRAIPYEGFSYLRQQIQSYRHYELFLDALVGWCENKLFWGVPQIQDLMKPLKSLSDETTGILFIEKYIDQKIQNDEIEKAITAAIALPFSTSTPSVLISLVQKAGELGYTDEVENLLISKLHSGVIRSLAGEPSPDLIQRKTRFQELHEKLEPGKMKIIIKKIIENIDHRIQNQLKRDEEFLNPRS